MKTNICLGDIFDNFLKEEGIFEVVHTKALKTAIAYKLKEMIKESGFTQSNLAKKMGTSRAVINRLLNPDKLDVTLITLDKIARSLGKRLCISFE